LSEEYCSNRNIEEEKFEIQNVVTLKKVFQKLKREHGEISS
jgi:hypothetical protein